MSDLRSSEARTTANLATLRINFQRPALERSGVAGRLVLNSKRPQAIYSIASLAKETRQGLLRPEATQERGARVQNAVGCRVGKQRQIVATGTIILAARTIGVT